MGGREVTRLRLAVGVATLILLIAGLNLMILHGTLFNVNVLMPLLGGLGLGDDRRAGNDRWQSGGDGSRRPHRRARRRTSFARPVVALRIVCRRNMGVQPEPTAFAAAMRRDGATNL